MADTTFPLPNSSYDELVKIIKAYSAVGRPATLDDVASRAAIGRTTVSGNNSFLVAVGVIDDGKKKEMTPIGQELAGALEYDIVENVAKAWRALISGTEFFEKIGSAVRIRSGMEQSALEAHIAYTAGQTKSGKTMTGARAVVDLLKAAGMLHDEDGKLQFKSHRREESSIETSERRLESTDSTAPRVEGREAHGISLAVSVVIQAGPDDLDDLAEKLKAFLGDFSQIDSSTV
jgi:hypothetical protein